jgi:hypothetical protein
MLRLGAGCLFQKERHMAEPITIYGGQSPEEIAFKLLYAISWGENIDLEAWGKTDRKMDTGYLCAMPGDGKKSGCPYCPICIRS